jgi:hypothetical protein
VAVGLFSATTLPANKRQTKVKYPVARLIPIIRGE